MSYQPQQNPNPERRFMNLSAGMLMLVITAVILLPLVLCLGCCAMGGIGSVLDSDSVEPTSSYSLGR